MTNLERFTGKDAQEILAILKEEQERAEVQAKLKEQYEKLGIRLTQAGDKVMIRLDGSYPVTQTKAGWIALQKLIPMAIQACDDFGIAPVGEKKAA